MEFQTKIFVRVNNRGARMADAGGGLLMLAIVLIGVIKAVKLGGFILPISVVGLAIIGIALVFIGRSEAKGNMFEIGLSDTDLILGEERIQVGNESYLLDQIKDLDFWIEGYDGMIGPRFKGYRSFRNQGSMSGADNKIHFKAGGKRHLYQFYLQDNDSMQQLGQLFEKYYAQGVPFRECNRGGPTFLFQQVRSKEELRQLKSRHGYR